MAMAASVANISNVQALLDQARRLKLKRMTVQISSACPSHGMDRLMGGDGWPHVLRALCKKRMDRLDGDISTETAAAIHLLVDVQCG